MHPPSQPWSCGRCQNVNDARSLRCLRCGWSPAANPAQAQAVRPAPLPTRRPLPPYSKQTLAVCYSIGVAIVFLVGWLVLPRAANDSASDESFRVHTSDVQSMDAAGNPTAIRCKVCKGSGRTARFGHTGDGKSQSDYFPDGEVTCPFCNGTGIESGYQIGKVKIVGADQPTSY